MILNTFVAMSCEDTKHFVQPKSGALVMNKAEGTGSQTKIELKGDSG